MALMHAGGAVTDWLTAVGTVGAVGVALWFSRKERAEHVRIRCGIGRVVALGAADGMGGFGPGAEEWVIRVNVTNVGPLPVTVSGLHWEAGYLRGKVYWFQTTPMNAGTTRLPTRLESHGQDATIYLNPKVLLRAPGGFLPAHIAKARLPWLTTRSVRICVTTTTGRTFRAKPNGAVLRMLETGKLPPEIPS